MPTVSVDGAVADLHEFERSGIYQFKHAHLRPLGAALHKGGYDMRVSHSACPKIIPARSKFVLASVMERETLLQHLSSAKWHVEEGDSQITAQKRIISDLMDARSDTTEADMVLRMFERSQSSLMMDLEKILDVLDKVPLFEDDDQS